MEAIFQRVLSSFKWRVTAAAAEAGSLGSQKIIPRTWDSINLSRVQEFPETAVNS